MRTRMSLFGAMVMSAAYFLLPYNSLAQTWDLGKKVVPGIRMDDDRFGWSTDIQENILVVGAYLHDLDSMGTDTLLDAGLVYIFEQDTNKTWVEKQRINASDRDAGGKFGYSVSISGNYLIVGAFEEDYDSLGLNYQYNAGAAYIFKKNLAGHWHEVQKIVPSDRSSSEVFGGSVNIDGIYAVVGAMWESYDTTNTVNISAAGSAYIFKMSPSGIWKQVQKIHAPVRGTIDLFGYDVAIFDDWIVAGAYNESEDVNESNTMTTSGSAYFYKRNNAGKYLFKQKVTASVRDTNAFFARRVDIYDNYAVFGAEGEDFDSLGQNMLESSGAVYVFERNSSNVWQQKQKLVPLDRSLFIWFGWDVSVSANYIIGGSYHDNYDANGLNFKSSAGSAVIFSKNSSNDWVQRQKIVAYDRQASDLFASSVNQSGDIFVVGAQFQDYDASGMNYSSAAGAAYTYDLCQASVYADSLSMCSGDSAFLQGAWRYAAGTYRDTFTSVLSGCDSVVSVKLSLDPGPSITSVNHASRCGTGSVTLKANASAGSVLWYASSSGGSSLSTGISYTTGSLSSTTTYYVEALNSGCTSPARTPVVAVINAIPSISSTTPGSVCDSGQVTLAASASFGSMSWFDSPTAILRIGVGSTFNTPILTNTTNYYVEAMDSACVSTRTLVTAFVYPTPTILTTTGASTCDTGSLTLMATISAGTLKWYGALTGGPALGTNSPFITPVLTSTTMYYAEAAANGCQSPRTAVVATILHSSASILNETACFSYTTPSGKSTYYESGTYMDKLINVAGCDSNITIILTINKVDTSVNQTGPQLTSNSNGTCQWIDCDNANSPISGATNKTYTATSNGRYAVIVTEKNCTDTSRCLEVSGIGISTISRQGMISIYPNPTQGQFMVELGRTYDELRLIVRNQLGQLVVDEAFINSSKLYGEIKQASGIYLMEIWHGNSLLISHRISKK